MRQCETGTITQTPDELRPALIDWSTCLGPDEIITDSSFIADSTEYTISDESFTDLTAKFWLTGGIEGNSYVITNRITTSEGEIIEASIPFNCGTYNYVVGGGCEDNC